MKFINFSVLFVLLALSSFPALAGERTYGDLTATVVSVYDGDTMTVNIPDVPALLGENIPIRVRGIDTPEMHDKRPEICGGVDIASELVKAGLAGGDYEGGTKEKW